MSAEPKLASHPSYRLVSATQALPVHACSRVLGCCRSASAFSHDFSEERLQRVGGGVGNEVKVAARGGRVGMGERVARLVITRVVRDDDRAAVAARFGE